MSNDGKVTVSVLNRRTKNLTWIPGKFTDQSNNTWFVLNNGEIKCDNPPKNSKVQQMQENDYNNVRNLLLDGQQNTFQWDKSNEAEKGFIRFFKMHPQVHNVYSVEDVQEVNPETNLKPENEIPKVAKSVTEFEIKDHDIEAELSYHQADVEMRIMNAIGNMTNNEIYNLAYRYGISRPHEKQFRTIFVEVRNEAFKQGAKFLREVQEADEITTIASKAISYDIIKGDGANYMFGNQVLGSDFNQVLSNLKNDNQMYEKSVKPAVVEKDKQVLGTQEEEESHGIDPQKAETEPQNEGGNGNKGKSRRQKQ